MGGKGVLGEDGRRDERKRKGVDGVMRTKRRYKESMDELREEDIKKRLLKEWMK